MKVSSLSGLNPARPPHPANKRRQSEHILLFSRHLLIPPRPLPTTAGSGLFRLFSLDVTVPRVSFCLFSTCCSFHSDWLAGVMPDNLTNWTCFFEPVTAGLPAFGGPSVSGTDVHTKMQLVCKTGGTSETKAALQQFPGFADMHSSITENIMR